MRSSIAAARSSSASAGGYFAKYVFGSIVSW
jgi:hypothetical protein